MFDDLFGTKYSKPIYIEKVAATAALAGRCEERCLLGRVFYSLIKDSNGIYRFNADIYNDAKSLLALDFENQFTLAFGLMRLPTNDIRRTFDPRQSCRDATKTNRVVAIAMDALKKELDFPEQDIGLIGSLGIDTEAGDQTPLHDLDLVFCGALRQVSRAYNWVNSSHLPGQPLRRSLDSGLPIVCSFFAVEPSPYQFLTDLRVCASIVEPIMVTLLTEMSPAFLNIQLYDAVIEGTGSSVVVVVRDTLSRSMLPIHRVLEMRGYPSAIGSRTAFLVTDVEQQVPSISYHGGGTDANA